MCLQELTIPKTWHALISSILQFITGLLVSFLLCYFFLLTLWWTKFYIKSVNYNNTMYIWYIYGVGHTWILKLQIHLTSVQHHPFLQHYTEIVIFTLISNNDLLKLAFYYKQCTLQEYAITTLTSWLTTFSNIINC